jgi:TrmH family RNA methyltransferase
MDLKPLTWYTSLKTHKGRMAERAFLIEGPRAVAQIARYYPTVVREILLPAGHDPAALSRFPIRQLTERQLAGICSSHTPQGIAAVAAIPDDAFSDTLPAEPGDRILYLDDIQDPGNVGTLMRTAAALGWSGLILSEKCADPFAPKVVQSAAGANFSVWVRKTAAGLQMVQNLKRAGATIVAADVNGSDRPPLSPRGGCVLMLGNEGNGLSLPALGLADVSYRIPIVSEAVESLNVAAAGAICMQALRRTLYPEP